MLNHDTDRLWISDKRVEKLILDTLNGKTPLASNKKLNESAKKLSGEISDLSEEFNQQIVTIADYLYALTLMDDYLSGRIGALQTAVTEVADSLQDLTATVGNLSDTVDTMSGTVAQHTLDIADLDRRVTALEQEE